MNFNDVLTATSTPELDYALHLTLHCPHYDNTSYGFDKMSDRASSFQPLAAGLVAASHV